ncbi:hypothetical protein [Streptomyces sp. NPDC026673]|uniref:hypothetical protein n=1 Tax=Streptomyces sp. NPDC026673 TaxID=3155724 RepID=UPI0033E7AD1F
MLISDGDKPPVTPALNNPRGRFLTDGNPPAAVPVFILPPRRFIAGPAPRTDRDGPPGSRVPKSPVCADGRVCAFADADEPGNS